mgnify:CR=1 FL=1
MDRKETVKDFHNRIIGYYIYKDNGDIEARDALNKILGYYRRHTDTTTDAYNRILSRGNTIGSLLR